MGMNLDTGAGSNVCEEVLCCVMKKVKEKRMLERSK